VSYLLDTNVLSELVRAKRKEKLRLWLEHELLDWFGERILNIDAGVAERWGRLQASI